MNDDDFWVYYGYIKVMMQYFFSFSFSWKFGFAKRAERYCNGIDAKLPFLVFLFFALLFIPLLLFIDTIIIHW